MHTRIHLLTGALLAASIAASAVAQVTPVTPTPVAPSVRSVDRAQAASLPTGITAKKLNEDRSIDRTFKNLTESSLSRNGFDGVVDNLVDQDRDRLTKSLPEKRTLGNVDGSDNKRFKDLVDAFNVSWKAKYNSALDIDINKTFVADFLRIQTGEVSDAQQLVGKWPIPNPKMTVSGATQQPGAAGTITKSDADEAQAKMFGGDVNLEKGRNVAIVFIPGSHGMPGVNVSLIHESVGGWKIDLPNNINADRLYNNLVNNLTRVHEMKANWPADGNAGNRLVAHAVVLSLYDITLDANTITASEKDAVK
jgi:hypothetical protein